MQVLSVKQTSFFLFFFELLHELPSPRTVALWAASSRENFYIYIRNNYAPINVILNYHRYGLKTGKDGDGEGINCKIFPTVVITEEFKDMCFL